MARVVDIEPTIIRLKEIYEESKYSDWKFAGMNLGMAGYLEKLPQIIIPSEVHGNWVRFVGTGSARCSLCGYSVKDISMITRFCGNCGAKMDGGL